MNVENSINILCSTDDNYVPYCGIMLTSLFENNKDAKIHVYLMTETMSDSNWARLQELTRKYSQNISPIIIDSRKLKDCPMHDDDYVSLATYYRLLAPQLLPQEIDKILYLDCDMIIDQSIESLYNTDIENYALAAALDEDYMNEGKYQRLEYTFEKKYFNAGVLLINLKYWRDYKVMQRCFEYIKGNACKLIFHDQDTLNFVLKDEKKEIHIKNNFQTGFIHKKRYVEPGLINDINESVVAPVVIHYTGLNKPWKYGVHPYKNHFLHYKSISAWSGTRQEYGRSIKERIVECIYSIFYALRIKKQHYSFTIPEQNK